MSGRAKLITPGNIQGFTDVLTPYPYITNYAATVNYTLNPTTFIEGTYGFIRNELAGGNEGGVLVNESANRLSRRQRPGRTSPSSIRTRASSISATTRTRSCRT